MELTLKTFLIACPLVFLGGFIDSIAGGGGLITLPAYVLAGLPAHYCVGTNKVSSCMGTSVTFFRVIKRKMLVAKLFIPGVIAAVIGSGIGSRLSLLMDEEVLKKIMLFVLPVCAVIVLNKKAFKDIPKEEEIIDTKTIIVTTVISFALGMYDGFYGPGAGTFMLMGYMMISKLSMETSYGQMKIINLTSNIIALLTFLKGGVILLPLGLACGVCNMLGNYLGSGLALKNGSRIVRPVIVVVVLLFMVKILVNF